MLETPPYGDLKARIKELEEEFGKRKLTEKALQESEERFRAAFMGSPHAAVISTLDDGIWVDANDVALEVFGYTRKEAIGKSVLERNLWVNPGDRQRLLAEMGRKGEVKNQEVQLRRMDGSLIMTSLSVRTITLKGVKHLLFVADDITERKKTEEALRQSEEKYKLLAKHSADVIYRLGLESERCMYVSPSAERILGYSSEELLSLRIEEVLTPESYKKQRKGMEEASARRFRGSEILELEAIHKDGRTIPVEISANFIFNDQGMPVEILGVMRDITRRKQDEEEKERLQARLLQAQKMESVGRLAGGVAHDFNNMLGIIIGHAEMAALRVTSDETLHQHLQEIIKASYRSADTVRQLLAFARKQTISPKILDLNDTISGMLQMLRRLIGEDIELTCTQGKHLGKVRMDPSQVNQILANLVVNSRDAIQGVGKVTIESARAFFDESYCREHAGHIPGEYVLLSVSDTGTGMSPEVMEHLFDPFFTTKEVGKGTGLGLATVYGIVKQNNGFIHVESEPGQGTTFKIYLPRVRCESSAALERKDEKLLRGTETVLIVEDEESLLNTTRDILRSLGYTVLAASTPTAALSLSAEHSGRIHLLLADVVMPEMNGQKLAERLKSKHPDLKILFMSGYTADILAPHGVLDKGVYFIEKPFSPRSLTEKVREVLDRPDRG